MIEVSEMANSPVGSVCYVVHDCRRGDGCIVIDPGSEDSSPLFRLLEEMRLVPVAIILTHEHFDHCWGVNAIRDRYPGVRLVCSREVSEKIIDPKKNCSVFYDNTKAFSIAPADIFAEGRMNLGSFDVEFIPTPGHTPGSISVQIGSNLFTGDAYIPGLKTVTKLPGGDKSKATESEKLICEIAEKSGLTICPGHIIE